ncbi:MAG: hypothetical protein ACXADB_11165 [Candidatus Hermodarchaeia archaeon]
MPSNLSERAEDLFVEKQYNCAQATFTAGCEPEDRFYIRWWNRSDGKRLWGFNWCINGTRSKIR